MNNLQTRIGGPLSPPLKKAPQIAAPTPAKKSPRIEPDSAIFEASRKAGLPLQIRGKDGQTFDGVVVSHGLYSVQIRLQGGGRAVLFKSYLATVIVPPSIPQEERS